MTREEAILKWIIPAIKNTWNEKKCNEILKALEQEPCDKCVYSTKDGYCQYDDITETIPPLKLCEDCISREYILSKAHCCCDDLADDELCCVDVDDIKEAPSIQPKPKKGHWIPISERLPDVGDEYLVTVRERWGKDEEWEYETVGAFYASGWELSYDIDEGQEWEVIAWMPLPEPYKAESEKI